MVVGLAEQLSERDAGTDDLSPGGVDEGAVAGSENVVAQERFGFGPVVDGVAGRGRAGAESGDLREG